MFHHRPLVPRSSRPIARAFFSLLAILLIASPEIGRARNGAGDTFTGVELRIPDETVPPGGVLQLKVEVTEPKPILKGRQRVGLSTSKASTRSSVFNADASPLVSTPLGPIQGIALFSQKGDASGVAVSDTSGTRFFFSSPLSSFGTNSDYPVLTINAPVKKNATVGQSADMILDLGDTEWLDPTGNPYPTQFTSGVFTVGGTFAISSVTPGGTTVPAGQPISIKGLGFASDAEVQVDGAKVDTTQVIGPTEIRITLTKAFNLEHHRVRVINKQANDRVEYFPYQPTTNMGVSKHALIASSYPLFPRTVWTVAYLKPVLDGTTFSALALQNLKPTPIRVRLELYSNQGSLLTARTLSLGTNQRFTRDMVDLFPGFSASDGATVKIKAMAPIQVLGLQGDDTTGEVLPVAPSATP